MRLVSWNCRDGFQEKAEHLLRLSPDIAVVSEVRFAALAALGSGVASVWTGQGGFHGRRLVRPLRRLRTTECGRRTVHC